MRMKIGKNIWNFIILIVTLAVMMPGALALTAANPPEPSYITNPEEVISVDGNPAPAVSYGEWNLDKDFFAYMTEAEIHGDGSDYDFLSKLYLRYDCTEGVLYAMVLLEPDTVINDSKSENLFIKVNTTTETVDVNDGIVLVNGNTDDDGNAPDLHYINGSNDKIIGWEASASLAAGSYRICVRTQVDTQSEVDIPSATGSHQTGIPLEIKCSPNVPIPEFPTIALPVMAILGLMFIFGRKRDL